MAQCLNCFFEYESEDNICPSCGCNPGSRVSPDGCLEPGTIIAERFSLGYAQKKDGFGFTYTGLDKKTGRTVTVREYMPFGSAVRDADGRRVRFTGNPGEFAKKVGEIISFADRLRSFDYYEAIPHIVDFGLENDTAYIITEYDKGESVRDIVEREGTYSFRNTVADITPVIRAVDGLHREGILHGNITPESIMICSSGKVMLSDFALIFSGSPDTESPFIAPERIQGGEAVPQSDIFSVCAVIYYMLTGKEPAAGKEGFEPYFELKNVIELPQDADTALMRGLSVNPDERQSEAEDILNALLGKKVFKLSENLDLPPETNPEPPAEKKKKALNKPLMIISALAAALGICFIAMSIKYLKVIKANNGNGNVGGTAVTDESASAVTPGDSDGEILPADAKSIYLEFLRGSGFSSAYRTAYAVRTKDVELYNEIEELPPGVHNLDKARFSQYFYDIDDDGVNECLLVTDLDGGFEYITLYIFDIDEGRNVFEGGRIVCNDGTIEDLRLCTARAGNASAYYFLRFTVDAFGEEGVNNNSFEALYYNGTELICVASAGADKYLEDEAGEFAYTGAGLTPDGDIWDILNPSPQRSLYVFDDDRYVESPDDYAVVDRDTFEFIWLRNVVSAYTKVLVKSAERGNTGVQVSVMFPGLELGAKDIQLERRTPAGEEVFLYTADGRPLQFTRTLSKKDFREPYRVEIYYDGTRYVSCTITLDADGNPVYDQEEPELVKLPNVMGMRRERALNEIEAAGFEYARAVNGASHGLLGLFNIGKVEKVNVAVNEYYPRDTEIIIYTSM